MELIILFLPGPLIFLLSLLMTKRYFMGVVYFIAAAGTIIWHESLPPITSSDAAGNGMAMGFRALGFYSAASGLMFAGLYACLHQLLRLESGGTFKKVMLIVVGLIGATFSMFLMMG